MNRLLTIGLLAVLALGAVGTFPFGLAGAHENQARVHCHNVVHELPPDGWWECDGNPGHVWFEHRNEYRCSHRGFLGETIRCTLPRIAEARLGRVGWSFEPLQEGVTARIGGPATERPRLLLVTPDRFGSFEVKVNAHWHQVGAYGEETVRSPHTTSVVYTIYFDQAVQPVEPEVAADTALIDALRLRISSLESERDHWRDRAVAAEGVRRFEVEFEIRIDGTYLTMATLEGGWGVSLGESRMAVECTAGICRPVSVRRGTQ